MSSPPAQYDIALLPPPVRVLPSHGVQQKRGYRLSAVEGGSAFLFFVALKVVRPGLIGLCSLPLPHRARPLQQASRKFYIISPMPAGGGGRGERRAYKKGENKALCVWSSCSPSEVLHPNCQPLPAQRPTHVPPMPHAPFLHSGSGAIHPGGEGGHQGRTWGGGRCRDPPDV